MNRSILFMLCMMVLSPYAWAQTDSVVFKNGNVMVGEIKDLDKGVFTIETDYSEEDFKIKWNDIKEIYTDTYFLITLSDGRRLNGKVKTISPGKDLIIADDSIEVEVAHETLVFLKAVEGGFWSKFNASVDFGFSYTKASNLRQLNFSGNFGYTAETWSIDLSSNSVNSIQDEVEPIERTDMTITGRYFLPKDWFVFADVSLLSNTEQKLDLRTNGKSGMGKFIVHTNRQYWAIYGGLSFNNEKFSTEESPKKSLEGYFGTALNLFDIGDLSLLTRANAYPSITEKGRWRADFKIDLKYDLPLDFYIKFGYTMNYDNQPVEGAASSDYVFQTSIGWEL